MNKEIDLKNKFDMYGITASTVCAVHCVATPIILPIISVLGITVSASHWFEYTMIAIALVTGGYALYTGYKKHHNVLPSLLFVPGLAVLLLGHNHEHLGWSTLKPVFGAGLIITAHTINYLKSKSAHCTHDTDH